MRGRKPAVDPDVILSAVLRFKERVIIIDENGQKSKSLHFIINIYK